MTIPDRKQTLAKLKAALAGLREMLDDDIYRGETPMEVQWVMEKAAEALHQALRALGPPPDRAGAVTPAAAPTPKQGQFLAYIRAYMQHNTASVAPTHAALQKFFNLTPPSVNSMLIRLEERGFIERIPGQTRAIRLSIDPALIPELERPFKL